jgi:hypothetical protein
MRYRPVTLPRAAAGPHRAASDPDREHLSDSFLVCAPAALAGPRAAPPAAPLPRRPARRQPSLMIWASCPAISARACRGCLWPVSAWYTALEMARLAWS